MDCRILQAPNYAAFPWWSFPHSGNEWSQPLDSGLRRNDDWCFLFGFTENQRYHGRSYWMPACAGITERAEVRNLSGIAKGLSGWQFAYFLLVFIPVYLHRQALESTPAVIPAKAGIQEAKPK